MADLGILSVNVESGVGSNIPSDASGMLKKCQKNISLSYKKWKKYYKEIEHNRVKPSIYHNGPLSEYARGRSLDKR